MLDTRYRLDVRIAAGGMGEVWRGTDLALNRAVAVKLLHPEQASQADGLARFRAEAQHAGSLSHPNIAQVYDYCEPEPPDPAYLVLELVDGPSLACQLAAGPLSPERTLDVIEQTASGLAAAHRSGLLHRDIKPGNLLLSRDGLIKITDFGIARVAGSMVQTQTGGLTGTPAYLAPERVTGAPATAAVDIYALGVVAHQCLTGQVPFAGEPLVVALAHVERDMPPLPPSVPAALATLVADLTRKDPQARPASATAVRAQAGLVRAALSGAAPPGRAGFAGISPAATGSAGPPLSPAATGSPISPVGPAATATGLASTSPTAVSPAGPAPSSLASPAPSSDSVSADTSFAGTSADVSIPARHPAQHGAAAGGPLHRMAPGRRPPGRGRLGRPGLALASTAAAALASVAIWLLSGDPGGGPAAPDSPGRVPNAEQASPRHPAARPQTPGHQAAGHGSGAGQPDSQVAVAHPKAGHQRQHRSRPGPARPSSTGAAPTPSAVPTPSTAPTPSASVSPAVSPPAATPSPSVSRDGATPSGELALGNPGGG